MGTDHSPRDKQAHLARPSLWVAEPADDSFSLLENALRGDEPSLWDNNGHTEDVRSLIDENARLRGLVVQLSTLIPKNSNAVAVSWQDRSQCWRAHAPCPRRPYLSTLTPYGPREKRAARNHEQIREFCQFLAHEWKGNRQHSYAVPSRGKSRGWSRTVDGKWSAVGLADAVSKYAWRGKNFAENKAELDRLAAELQSAIQRGSNSDVCAILQAIMHWGGVDNNFRQKRTFEWIERNADEISAKLIERRRSD